MSETLPELIENSLQISWDFIEGSCEIIDPQQTAELLLNSIRDQVLRGERRTLMLANRAIDAHRQNKHAMAA